MHCFGLRHRDSSGLHTTGKGNRFIGLVQCGCQRLRSLFLPIKIAWTADPEQFKEFLESSGPSELQGRLHSRDLLFVFRWKESLFTSKCNSWHVSDAHNYFCFTQQSTDAQYCSSMTREFCFFWQPSVWGDSVVNLETQSVFSLVFLCCFLLFTKPMGGKIALMCGLP